MKLEAIKKKMLAYHDLYGGDLLNQDEIIEAKTKKDLAIIIENHGSHMEAMLSDAQSNLDNFKRELGLTYLP